MLTECAHKGCKKGLKTGHALHRVSPKGKSFVGMCDEHFLGEINPIAQAIQDDNLARQ